MVFARARGDSICGAFPTAMKEIEPFALAISRLENDPESDRLKKLLLCTCQNRWENDPKKLDALDWLTLLGQVRATMPSRRQLRESLVRVVARINKKSLYFSLAVRALSALYPLYAGTSRQLACQISPSENRWFDLRLTLSQVASLSQAKMLVHSAIHGQISYTTQDWNQLNHQEFDSLARSLFEICPTAEDLAMRLFGVAKCLDRPAEYDAIAQVLYREMELFYSGSSTDVPFLDFPMADEDDDFDLTFTFPADEGSIRKTGLDVNPDPSPSPPVSPSIHAYIEREKAARDVANRHLEIATDTIEQSAQKLEADVRALLAEIEPAVARSLTGQILREFFGSLQRTCDRHVERWNSQERPEKTETIANPPPESP
ncbi:MAG: hypothetical protein J7641_04135 [Cyanobacteria bacterium SID2]|nr:hypothetical protein [Cyanobacteria bacterium SID2]MBP0002744.1 hypothetical protein [Cyanobacteria bacterium SBC]